MVGPEHVETCRAMKPLDERQVFGKSIFLFDGANRAELSRMGEIRTPGVADIFVATMKGTYA
jgi:ABC-2 type transport system ATP-binding protein